MKIVSLTIATLVGCVALGFYAKSQMEQSHVNSLVVQEKCAAQAHRYAAEHKSGSESQSPTLALNHYNYGLRKCFAILDEMVDSGQGITDQTTVVDVFEGRYVAGIKYTLSAKNFDVKDCYENLSDGTRPTCKSMDEFNAIRKKYIE